MLPKFESTQQRNMMQ